MHHGELEGFYTMDPKHDGVWWINKMVSSNKLIEQRNFLFFEYRSLELDRKISLMVTSVVIPDRVISNRWNNNGEWWHMNSSSLNKWSKAYDRQTTAAAFFFHQLRQINIILTSHTLVIWKENRWEKKVYNQIDEMRKGKEKLQITKV